MTLSKAIEINSAFTHQPHKEVDPDLIDAINMGKEALKRTMSNRDSVHPIIDQLLPGETED